MASANLKISYLGDDYDFPQFFEHSEIRILAEGLPISVECRYQRTPQRGNSQNPVVHQRILAQGWVSSEASLVYPCAVPTRTLARPDRRCDPT